MGVPLLEIEGLEVDFRSHDRWVRAVDGVSFTMERGETLCLVGESGSGKSVTAQSIARLVPTPPGRYSGGAIRIHGRDVLGASAEEVRQLRGRVVSYIFQEPGASLNPVYRVGDQILESLRMYRAKDARIDHVVELLKQVGMPAPESRVRDYPHQMSGGMQQRVMIAMALASSPELLVADEPTTALDVTIQAQILELLLELKQRHGMAMLLITHNLGIVGDLADQVAVLYAGQVVEKGPAAAVLQSPRHPYTRALLDSVPELGQDVGRLTAIPGTVPHPGDWGMGCRFADRCQIARESCRVAEPQWIELEPGGRHGVRCPYGGELA